MQRRQAVLCWVLASAGLMIIGAFGPWAKVLAFSVSGTDGGNDGWVIVVAAAVSAGLFLWARDQPFIGFAAIAAGLLGAIVTISDRRDLTAAADGNELADGLVQIGWGLNLATVASISLAIAGIVWTRLPQPAAADTQKPDSPSELAGPDAQVNERGGDATL